MAGGVVQVSTHVSNAVLCSLPYRWLIHHDPCKNAASVLHQVPLHVMTQAWCEQAVSAAIQVQAELCNAWHPVDNSLEFMRHKWCSLSGIGCRAAPAWLSNLSILLPPSC